MVAIIDYGVGNLYSVRNVFAACGAETTVTNKEEDLRKADKIVLPGVGAFGDAMDNLVGTRLVPCIKELAAGNKPLLGICVGLQLLFDESDESPGVSGLGIIPGKVRKIKAPHLKIPHIGWNDLTIKEKRGIFAEMPENPYFYFVHSYFAVPKDEGAVTAYTEYGEKITAAVKKENVQGTQFHPEKSGDLGLKLIKNFLSQQ